MYVELVSTRRLNRAASAKRTPEDGVVDDPLAGRTKFGGEG